MNDSSTPTPQAPPQAVDKFSGMALIDLVKVVDGTHASFDRLVEFVDCLGEVRAADGNYRRATNDWSYFSIRGEDEQSRPWLIGVAPGEWVANIAGKLFVLDNITAEMIVRGQA